MTQGVTKAPALTRVPLRMLPLLNEGQELKDWHLPAYKSETAAAFDIALQSPITITEEAQVVPLRFKAAVPVGYVALLAPRSGIGFKKGAELNNTIGIIDSDFRGEWLASLRLKSSSSGHPQTPVELEEGDAAVQCMIVPVVQAEFLIASAVEELGETARGEGGFGSTGDGVKFVNQ